MKLLSGFNLFWSRIKILSSCFYVPIVIILFPSIVFIGWNK